MAGHSHWAGIKHKKGAADAKRGKLFSRLTKNIMIAVRDGGSDPDSNLALRYAIDKAKEANMPKTNIERTIKKFSGAGANAANFVDLTYEGYGPGGIAILVEVVTDNRNRTASEFRNIFETKGGKLGESGCVSYLFNKKGWISVPVSAIEEEKLLDIILDAGAEDLTTNEDFFEITMDITDFNNVRQALQAAEIPVNSAELVQIPQNTIALDAKNGRKLLSLLETLEDHDDVQNVYANYDLPEDVLEELER